MYFVLEIKHKKYGSLYFSTLKESNKGMALYIATKHCNGLASFIEEHKIKDEIEIEVIHRSKSKKNCQDFLRNKIHTMIKPDHLFNTWYINESITASVRIPKDTYNVIVDKFGSFSEFVKQCALKLN